MGKYQVHRSDANAAPVIDAMRAAGATVEPLGRPVDVLVGVDGLSGVAEIKTLKGKVRKGQAEFFARFTGAKALVRTPEEGIAFVRKLKRVARLAGGVTW